MSKILATPAARVYAKEKNIDLANVVGSGKYGAIVLKDLENVLPVMREKGVKITPVAKNVMNYYDVDIKDVAYSNNKITKVICQENPVRSFTFQQNSDIIF